MKNTYVFIDSQNLFKTFERNGNILDMSKFYLYLKNNLKADKIFLFLGYINSKQYRFKPIYKTQKCICNIFDTNFYIVVNLQFRTLDL